MIVELKENERIDDLEYKDLKIIQNKEGFCFGIDSILLVDFAKKIKDNTCVLDLGTGTGIIPILLSQKTKLKKAYAVEIQEEVADMAKRSVELNRLGEKIEIINDNIKNIQEYFKNQSIDVIITNPPYKKKNSGIINEEEKKIISRHEITASLEDFIKEGSKVLKDKGEFYMVNRPERLVDIVVAMRKYKIEPKLIRMVYSKVEKSPVLVLVKGIKNANPFLRIEPNLYIYDKNGEYTDEIYKIYNKKRIDRNE